MLSSSCRTQGPPAPFELSKRWVRWEWARGERREDWEEIFDYMAGMVGASRREFLGGAVAVGDCDRSYAVRAGSFDVEVAVTDHACGGGIEGLLFE